MRFLNKFKDLPAGVQKLVQEWVIILNGQLSFGDGTASDNISGVWVNVISPAVANTDFTVTHLLGRVPSGFIVMQSSAPGSVYIGGIPATKNSMTLRSDAVNVTLRLFVL